MKSLRGTTRRAGQQDIITLREVRQIGSSKQRVRITVLKNRYGSRVRSNDYVRTAT